jgi:hypothetical protein
MEPEGMVVYQLDGDVYLPLEANATYHARAFVKMYRYNPPYAYNNVFFGIKVLDSGNNVLATYEKQIHAYSEPRGNNDTTSDWNYVEVSGAAGNTAAKAFVYFRFLGSGDNSIDIADVSIGSTKNVELYYAQENIVGNTSTYNDAKHILNGRVDIKNGSLNIMSGETGQWATPTVETLNVNGSIAYTGDLKSYNAGNLYDGYIYVPLQVPLTSTSFDGDLFGTVGSSTAINLVSLFGLPTGVKAVNMKVRIVDTGGVTGNYWFACGATTTAWDMHRVFCYGTVNGVELYNEDSFIVSTNAANNNQIYYRTSSSGASTLSVMIKINGYYL